MCDFKTEWKTSLNMHIKGFHSNEKEDCLICNKTIQKKNYQVHVRRHQGSVLLECDLCKFSTVNKNSLKKHKKYIHGASLIQNQSCTFPDCGKTYTRKGELIEHIKSKHIGEKLQCDICDFQTTIKASLRGHKLNVHGTISKECCDICGYRGTSNSLRRHKRRTHQLTA